MCKNSHLWVDSDDLCPTCREHWTDEITRVVGKESNNK